MAQACSGLSKQAYCKEQGIKPSTFYAWQRKLRGEQMSEAAAAAGFTQLLPQGEAEYELTVCLGQGELHLRSNSPSTLARILKELAHA
ncbi:MAG: hypothetical protein D6772_16510 [Bacteroidetes bacterium]|nr:MAG: hypothetical protein D6772_16510 [Bacteroidota bacterium]